jgi:hypothetical protein
MEYKLMPIALMFPFAEAAGITLTGLGIAKATDIIMNYIQANPEKIKTNFINFNANHRRHWLYANERKIRRYFW